MTPADFGTKMAYVQLTPSKPVASAKKATVPAKTPASPAPPAAAPTQWVMRAAPSVPNPIAPPPKPTKIQSPSVKSAECAKAPNYTAMGKGGRRIMPQPHAKRTIRVQTQRTAQSPVAFGKALAENN